MIFGCTSSLKPTVATLRFGSKHFFRRFQSVDIGAAGDPAHYQSVEEIEMEMEKRVENMKRLLVGKIIYFISFLRALRRIFSAKIDCNVIFFWVNI